MSSVSNGASGVSNDRASPAATTKRNTRGKEDLVAGAAAGAIARFIVSPLDMLKIRYQLQTTSGGERKYRSLRSAAKVILYEEGITAFWKGNMLATAMIVPYSATAFAVNQKVKATFLDSNRTPHPGFSLLSGGFAGAAGVAVTYPLDLLRTRFVAQHGKNVRFSHPSVHLSVYS
jgi:solute carrier family 25 thiamine pyrophosphate transporter 19